MKAMTWKIKEYGTKYDIKVDLKGIQWKQWIG